MSRFEIRDDFYLDGQPFKILSGAIHYFRLHPDDWYSSLYNLKALGFNTVETYIPWNVHEPKKGQFIMSGRYDFERFLDLASELGLYAIVRPSPYICAEWEFGGLPAWLLPKQLRLRSSDDNFLAEVADYYDVLIPKLLRHELDRGGNVLMFQVENEYGSYGEDKAYLRAIKDMMQIRGIKQPLFTSDGPWRATLRAGSLIEDDVLVTGNFGSRAKENFEQMQSFFDEHGKKWPLMCMEFWDGWFNRWGEEIIRRDPKELTDSILEALEIGSINLYMFHGGTNFGFMNGCSARGQKDLPQVTSYDYDAILDESGNPTEKFFLLQEAMKKSYPELEYKEPIQKTFLEHTAELTNQVSLLSLVDRLDGYQKQYPVNMEDLGQNTGYILYQTIVERDKLEDERLRIIDGRDRVQVFRDRYQIATQYLDDIGEDIALSLPENKAQLSFLVENVGRVNYGHKLAASTQTKGLGRGAMLDLHYVTNWQIYPLPLEDLTFVDFSREWKENEPSFYEYSFELTDNEATYLDLSGFGKGCVFINGHALGRFWEIGPILSLYVPKGMLREGRNEIIVFETEGRYQKNINLVKNPIYKEM